MTPVAVWGAPMPTAAVLATGATRLPTALVALERSDAAR
jgi:hypothetical protein